MYACTCFRFHVSLCVVLSVCLVVFSIFSLNDPLPFGFVNWGLGFVAAVFIIASTSKKVITKRAYLKVAALLIVTLLVWATIHLVLHLSSDLDLPIHVSDSGRDFLGSTIAWAFVVIATFSASRTVRIGAYAVLESGGGHDSKERDDVELENESKDSSEQRNSLLLEDEEK